MTIRHKKTNRFYPDYSQLPAIGKSPEKICVSFCYLRYTANHKQTKPGFIQIISNCLLSEIVTVKIWVGYFSCSYFTFFSKKMLPYCPMLRCFIFPGGLSITTFLLSQLNILCTLKTLKICDSTWRCNFDSLTQ